MSIPANPMIALQTRPVNLSYASSFLKTVGCNVDDSITPPVIRTGREPEIMIMSGFNFNEYLISNSLTLMASSSCPPTNIKRQLFPHVDDAVYVPYANGGGAFSDITMDRGRLDEDGIDVFNDFLLLNSKYSSYIHELMWRLKPKLTLIVTLNEEGDEMYKPPHAHFLMEGFNVHLMTLPQGLPPYDVAYRLARHIHDTLKVALEGEAFTPYKAEVTAEGDLKSLSRLLSVHGIPFEQDGGDRFIVTVINRFTDQLLPIIDHFIPIYSLSVRRLAQ